MNIALIFAGGTGQRMRNTSKPKQFLELYGKPIIIYTLEHFETHSLIDGIIVVCLESWIDYLKKLLRKYNVDKVKYIVPGGQSGQESIFHGLQVAYQHYPSDSIVLIHDGVRPLIDAKTISDDISTVLKYGSAITVSPAIETVVLNNNDGRIGKIINRSLCEIAKAPQCFYLGEIYQAHLNANEQGKKDFVDSASLMQYYGKSLKTVIGPSENIKITTPSDYYIFRAITDAKENMQIMGV